MLKKFLVSAVLTLSLLSPAWAVSVSENKPFLAIYSSNDIGEQGRFVHDWVKFNPDYFKRTGSWEGFNKFIDEVKEKAGDRPIVLDMQVHGWDDLIVYSSESDYTGEHASMGYVLNKIDRTLNTHKLTLLFESCYGGYVYHHSIRNNKIKREYFEDFNAIPNFPIYGMSAHTSNYNNLIYMQYYYGIRPFFKDLREYEAMEPEVRQEKTCAHTEAIYHLWNFLTDLPSYGS